MARLGHSSLSVAVLAIAASGCVVAPGTRAPSVTTDVVNYLEREWPLDPTRAHAGGSVCPSCVDGCSGGGDANGTAAPPTEPMLAPPPKLRRQPAIPDHPGPAGRFFPVPTHNVFAPRLVGPPMAP